MSDLQFGLFLINMDTMGAFLFVIQFLSPLVRVVAATRLQAFIKPLITGLVLEASFLEVCNTWLTYSYSSLAVSHVTILKNTGIITCYNFLRFAMHSHTIGKLLSSGLCQTYHVSINTTLILRCH